ncbi:MAG: asparagine synthase (glutamine-hydrolyzing), partial [bacterium]
DSGTWIHPDRHTAFGHRRLSIIGLDTGCQPIVRDGYSIIYNGEIYNYLRLKSELSTKGYTFETKTDTEVLLQGYREWGSDVLDRVRGMFSFVIWDDDRERMFLARDPAGQKPLVYYAEGGEFAAASEIQTLLKQSLVSRKADPASLSWYLSMGYVPSARTGFFKIKKVPPGHYMTVKDGRIQDQVRYWDPVSLSPKSEPLSEDRLYDELRSRMNTAVERRLVSDVPVGAFLSGGIDSTLVVGLMQEMKSDPLKTVCVGFQEDRYDEREYGKEVADFFQTDHNEFEVDLELESVFSDLVRHFGEPFADSSAVPTYYVSKKAREVVKVVVSGDGGDELFGGYRRYRAMRYLNSVSNWTPGFLRRFMGGVGRNMDRPEDRRSRSGELQRLLSSVDQTPVQQYMGMVGLGADDLKARIGIGPLERPAQRGGDQWLERWFRKFDHVEDPAQQAMNVDIMSYLPEDLLVKVDITTMMNSLECRSPFLDRDLMELAFRIPPELKINGSDHKYCLKKAYDDYIPERVKKRSKQGFGVPLTKWYREGEEAQFLEDRLMSQNHAFYRMIDRYTLETTLEQHQAGDIDVAPFLWALTMMKGWFDEFDVKL